MKCITPRIATFVLFGLNILIASGALALIGFGIKYLEKEGNVQVFGDFSLGALSITAGTIALITSVFGCLAAIFTKAILLTIYSALLMLLFPVKLSLGIMSIAKIQSYDYFLLQITHTVRVLYRFHQGDFYNLQQELECCGIISYAEYSPVWPQSCCKYAPNEPNNCLKPFEKGCASTYAEMLEDYIETIGCLAVIFALIELVAAFLALIVSKHRKQMTDIFYNKFEETY